MSLPSILFFGSGASARRAIVGSRSIVPATSRHTAPAGMAPQDSTLQ